MADSKITALTALTAADPANDMIPIVDVSDTPPASGNTKRISINNILACSPSATLASATITGDLTVDTSTLKVDSANDRVGIGTATPAAKLIVRDGSNRNLLVSSDASQLGSAGVAIGSFTDNAAGYAPLSIIAGTSIGFGINGSTAMTLNSTGLGIGGAPAGRLSLQTASGQTNLTLKSAGSTLGAIIGLQADGTAYFYQGDALPITFSTTGTERLRLKETGQLRFIPLAADPSGAEAGDVYYNSSSNKLKCYNGSTWNDLF